MGGKWRNLIKGSAIFFAIYPNIAMNPRFFTRFQIMGLTIIILTLLIENRKVKYALGIIAFILMAIIFAPYSFHSVHDIKTYSQLLKENEVNINPFAWLLMKSSTLLMGNPQGLFYLSYVSCLLLCILWMHLNRHNPTLFALTPFLLLGNRALKYMAGGVMRNLIALQIASLIPIVSESHKEN